VNLNSAVDLTRRYRISAPLDTHFRQATCAEVDCPQYLMGWKLRYDTLSEKDKHLVTHCGRSFRITDGGAFIEFEAGQTCFAYRRHRTRIDKPEHFLVREGRGAVLMHASADDWTDDLHTHTDKVSEQKQRG